MHYFKSTLPFILATSIASAQNLGTAASTTALAEESPHCVPNYHNKCPDDFTGASPYINNQDYANSQLPVSTISGTLPSSTSTITIPGIGSRIVAKDTADNREDDSDSTADHQFNQGHPTESFSGLKSNNDEEGAASMLRARNWIGLLGLGLGLGVAL